MPRTTPRNAAVLAVAVMALGSVSPLPAPSPADAAHRDVVDATSASAGTPTDVERELVEWAQARFADAGMELPDDLVITFHRDAEPCEGNHGTYRTGTPDRVRICRNHDDAVIEDRLRRHALLHELAHAWTDHHLADERRAAFLELRGAESWNDRTDDWHDRGTEQAAEIIAWGLLDQQIGFLGIHDTTCDQLHAGFVALTASEPTAGLEQSC